MLFTSEIYYTREGEKMLKINNFSKAYAKSDKKAVDEISFEVKAGEVFGFLGSNGAGKTTTIKAVTGILSSFDGSIEVCGIDIKKDPTLAKKQIGYVSDDHAVYDKLSGKEYLNFIADVFGVSEKDRSERMESLACDFSMQDALAKSISSYSHGMKQKIAVMAALIHQPKLWVLDEPMTGLDPQSAFELKEKMKSHTQNGNAVFFSSHILEVVEKLCDRIAIIEKGKIVAVGTVEELKGGSDLESYFLKLTGGEK